MTKETTGTRRTVRRIFSPNKNKSEIQTNDEAKSDIANAAEANPAQASSAKTTKK
jgi:hypothetical protein